MRRALGITTVDAMVEEQRDKSGIKRLSEEDKRFYWMARKHISDFRARHLPGPAGARVLEIGPEEGAHVVHDTLDIKPGGTYQFDLTRCGVNDLPANYYDIIVCLEVLEHTVDPFAAVSNIEMMAKDGALCLFSAPWNFRMHGPLPDCWRFSIHGWKVLLRNFDILEIDALETPRRWLHPIHYNILARANASKWNIPQSVKFELVK